MKTSPTLLMEYATGALVPHWDELDDLATTPDGSRAFFIRPAIRLKDATRYIVAIRHVKDSKGNDIAAAPAFQALRDNSSSNEVSVGLRRSLYSDIIGKLQNQGVTTSDLQMAWDFTTASQQSTTGDMVSMRDQALAVVGTAGPTYKIDTVTDNPNPYIRRRINGTMTVPLYMTNPAICSQGSPPPGPGCPGCPSTAEPTASPRRTGPPTTPSWSRSPTSVTLGTTGAILQNAHGLLGDHTEGQDSYMAEILPAPALRRDRGGALGLRHDDVNPSQHHDRRHGQFQHVVDRHAPGLHQRASGHAHDGGQIATDPQTMPTACRRSTASTATTAATARAASAAACTWPSPPT